jgi:integrase
MTGGEWCCPFCPAEWFTLGREGTFAWKESSCRISECLNVRLEDIDLERRLVRVMGKGQKERFVPFGKRKLHARLFPADRMVQPPSGGRRRRLR